MHDRIRPAHRDPAVADAAADVDPSVENAAAAGRLARRRRMIRIAGIVASILLFAASLLVLGRTLATISFADLRAAVRATSAEQVALATAFTIGSYLALTGYDTLALRHLGQRIHYRIAALGSFTSFAISFMLGFPLVTGGTVRYWIYSRYGLGPGNVARLTVIAGVCFWLGMGLVLGVGLLFQAGDIAELNNFKVWLNMLLGAGVLGAVLAYMAWVAPGRRRLTLQGFRLEMPGLAVTTGQTVLGVIDVCMGAAVLYVLLPEGHGVDFLSFAAVYAFACILGIASHAPGGIGVFEATMLKAIPAPSQEAMLASLLLYRILYYVAPFILALALLGANEALRRWRYLREIVERGEEG
ncbi:MAG: UPF0104 family protein [Methylobacteriaceae bacterium]|nr:UPF0104 family protein [Methylobacteriaceae bacterium]